VNLIPELAMTDLRRYIRDVPGFPRPGIIFKDITPLLQSPSALAASIEALAGRAEPPDAVVAIESRGFVFGTGLALHWKVPLIPARKFGKLPGKTLRERYALEYGEDTLEIHADALEQGARVAIVDDLLATGGTASAARSLVEKLQGVVVGCGFLVELTFLEGRSRLPGVDVVSLIEY